MKAETIFSQLGLDTDLLSSGSFPVRTPIDGSTIAKITEDTAESLNAKTERCRDAFVKWRSVPPPQRGELVRLLGEELRANKEALGALVTLESGKILQEGLGEVQEMIDVCDFAVGLSRQLYGLTIASERPGHRMMETWHPLGPIGVITAFNFPVAPWAWNTAISLVCGDPVLWKPSEKTPLTAIACAALVEKACLRFGDAPEGLLEIIVGSRDLGEIMAKDHRLPLISATGSCAMGKAVAPLVAARLGKSLLELGGNNAMIVAPSADLDLAVRAILFSAVGTAGQRCTSLRRLIAHHSIKEELFSRLEKAYASIKVGDPFQDGTLVGPLIDEKAFNGMQAALTQAHEEGGQVVGGERVRLEGKENAFYVSPALIDLDEQTELVRQETFAPILYCMPYDRLQQAIDMQNSVSQGLSSCIFTNDLREAEEFLSATGSDCGIANVNIGPSGAEIGGAFGGEKDTGGGRESGSDVWKAYMRRATNTVNYSRELPLAQGIVFDTGDD